MPQNTIGMIGLGVMGRNLALNMASHGFAVAAWDLDTGKQEAAARKFAGQPLQVFATLPEFVASLESPRRVMLMVPAGKPVDAVIAELKPLLVAGDLIIDGGNSHFTDTARRSRELREAGLRFIGTGVSGGEEGALHGPSIMPGGHSEAWPLVKPLFQAIAAKAPDGSPCCEWVGVDGAGHFVKMVHNGIEYGDMQMICEAYYIMEQLLGLTPDEMGAIFAEWNRGELGSYLIEITASIMTKKDEQTGKPMIHVILDTAGQKGTGKWTSQVALDLGIPAMTIAEAVFARTLSALKEERLAASRLLPGPAFQFSGDKAAFVAMIRQALYASKICSYAQGFQLMAAAAAEYGWQLDFGQIAQLWRAGCIIRAVFLDQIRSAYGQDPALKNLLLDSYFARAIGQSQAAWRRVIATAVEAGIAIPAFTSALSYYDGYRSAQLPANLLQAQRDYFGAHTFERVDQPRGQFFHTIW